MFDVVDCASRKFFYDFKLMRIKLEVGFQVRYVLMTYKI